MDRIRSGGPFHERPHALQCLVIFRSQDEFVVIAKVNDPDLAVGEDERPTIAIVSPTHVRDKRHPQRRSELLHLVLGEIGPVSHPDFQQYREPCISPTEQDIPDNDRLNSDIMPDSM
jgi:hypothetical protein